MMLCLSDMNGGDIDEDDHTDEWISKINKGRLWKVTDKVYQLFCIMEKEMKLEFSDSCRDSFVESKKAGFIEDLLKNEELLIQWGFTTSDLPCNLHNTLLKLISELFMIIHGHAHASSCLELYKEQNKQTLSKKKALRSSLNKDTE